MEIVGENYRNDNQGSIHIERRGHIQNGCAVFKIRTSNSKHDFRPKTVLWLKMVLFSVGFVASFC